MKYKYLIKKDEFFADLEYQDLVQECNVVITLVSEMKYQILCSMST